MDIGTYVRFDLLQYVMSSQNMYAHMLVQERLQILPQLCIILYHYFFS